MFEKWDFDDWSVEQWSQIRDFPNYYISSYGRVYSEYTDAILKPQMSPGGYQHITLFKNKVGKIERIHRLVAQEFCPGEFENAWVNHIDGNKLNNYHENLEWVTARGNSHHAFDTGLMGRPRKKVRVVELNRVYNSIRDCAVDLHLHWQNIGKIIDIPNRTAGGYHFESMVS